MKKFSIVVPTFNRSYVLPRLLDSLVNQTYKDFEVLLIDDGSNDNTKEVCDRYIDKLCLRYFYKENGGKHTALNIGIEEAQGEYFIVIDSKGCLLEHALERLLEIWDSLPDKENYSTVLARLSSADGFIGLPFPEDRFITSLTDFHFLTGYKLKGFISGFGDCLYCDRTEIIKQYRFPEPEGTKFVPEYFIYDQIGEKYKAFGVNEVLEIIEYLEDGITKNAADYYNNNYIGILHGVVSRLDKVISVNKNIPFKAKVETWITYWTYVAMDHKNNAPRVEQMTLLGRICEVYYKFRTKLR